MLTMTLRGVPCWFIQPHEAGKSLAETILAQEQRMADRHVFIADLPATDDMVEMIERLHDRECEVTYVDHHLPTVEMAPTAEAKTVLENVIYLRSILGGRGRFVSRRDAPACPQLVEVGEAVDLRETESFIVAHNDADGFLTACKLVKLHYQQLDRDAALLDGPPDVKRNFSNYGRAFMRALAGIPVYDPQDPQPSLEARQKVYQAMERTLLAIPDAFNELERLGHAYEQAVSLASTIKIWPLHHGIWMADLTSYPITMKIDLHALSERIAAQPGCRFIAIRMKNGVVAKHHGTQVRVSLPARRQGTLDLRRYLPELLADVNSPEDGVIANVPFRLTLSELAFTGFCERLGERELATA